MTAVDALTAARRPSPDQLAEALDRAREFLHRYLGAPPEGLTTITLWAAATWIFDRFDTAPYLAVTSPTRSCGKTRALELLSLLVREPWHVVAPSAAAIFRKIAAKKPTLLLDELDTIFKPGATSETSEALRAILNAGYRKGATIPRATKTGELEEFPCFGPKAFAAIGELPGTLASRCITVRLQRVLKGTLAPFRWRVAAVEAGPIAAALADLLRNLDAEEPTPPRQLSDREAEVWTPLLAIANAAGPRWREEAERAAVRLSSEGEEDLRVRALLSVLETFKTSGASALPSAKLANALNEDTDAPFGEMHGGRGITATWLSRTLRQFGVASTELWLDGKCVRGFRRQDVEAAAFSYSNENARTLEPASQLAVRPSTLGEDSSERDFGGVLGQKNNGEAGPGGSPSSHGSESAKPLNTASELAFPGGTSQDERSHRDPQKVLGQESSSDAQSSTLALWTYMERQEAAGGPSKNQTPAPDGSAGRQRLLFAEEEVEVVI